MNYKRIYNQLIAKARQRTLEGYKERHHIVPKCMGGTDEKSNLVELTAREHFIAHLLLYQIHKTIPLLNAIRAFSMPSKSGVIRSKDYEWLRKEFSKKHSSFMKNYNKINGNPFKGKSHTDEVKNILSVCASKRIGELNSFYGKTHTPEAKLKIANGNKIYRETHGPIKLKPRSKEHAEKLSSSLKDHYTHNISKHIGMKRSDDAKRNISESLKRGKEIKRFAKLDMNDNIIEYFDYLADAYVDDVKVCGSNIKKALLGKIKYAYGFKWKYVN